MDDSPEDNKQQIAIPPEKPRTSHSSCQHWNQVNEFNFYPTGFRTDIYVIMTSFHDSRCYFSLPYFTGQWNQDLPVQFALEEEGKKESQMQSQKEWIK